MVGANYMGGKRNALRARIKDANGRVEKDHFMKQRYQILTKGLGDHANASESRGKALREIDFAHAKRDVGTSHSSCDVDASEKLSISLTPHIIRSTKRTHAYSQYETPPKKSRVLEAIDMNEPLSLKATVDRILRISDLVCLTETESDPISNTSKRRATSITSCRSPLGQRVGKITPGTHDDTAVSDDSSRLSSPIAKSTSHRNYFSEAIDLNERISYRSPERYVGDDNFDIATSSSDIGQILPSKWNSLSDAMSRKFNHDDSGFSELVFESDRDGTTSPALHQYGSNPALRNNASCRYYSKSSDGESGSSCIVYDNEASNKNSQSKRSLSWISYPSSDVREQDVPPQNSSFSGSRRSPSSGLSSQLALSQSRNPWLVLDEILDVYPLRQLDDGSDPFQHLDANLRKGLGYEANADTRISRLFPIRQERMQNWTYKQDWSTRSSTEDINVQRTEGQSNNSDSESDHRCMLKSNDMPEQSHNSSCGNSTVDSNQWISEESESIRTSSPVGGNTAINSTQETHVKSSLSANYKLSQQKSSVTTEPVPSDILPIMPRIDIASPTQKMQNVHSVNVSGPNLFDNIFDDTDEY